MIGEKSPLQLNDGIRSNDVANAEAAAPALAVRLAPSHEDKLKRGGREGLNVSNPTLTHDRPTKLFAL
jgi:hypothetical protein